MANAAAKKVVVVRTIEALADTSPCHATYRPMKLDRAPINAATAIIEDSLRVISCAVAGGAMSIANTSTIPITCNAATTVNPIKSSSPYRIMLTGSPLAAAMDGSYEVNKSSL